MNVIFEAVSYLILSNTFISVFYNCFTAQINYMTKIAAKYTIKGTLISNWISSTYFVSKENVFVNFLSICFLLSFSWVIYQKIRQSKINSRWVAGPIGQTNRRPSVWCSKYYFFRLFIDLGHSKLFTFIFVFF